MQPIACASSRHEFTRGVELIRAFLSLPSSHLCISVPPFLPLFFTVSRAISHLASFSLSFLRDNRFDRSDQQFEKKFFYRFRRFLVFSSRLYFSPDYIFFFNEEKFGNKASTMNGEKRRCSNKRRLIDREYRFFFRHKSPFIDVYFERYLKRLVRLVLLDQE